ncbi:MAG: hypothetical protein ABMA15_21115 [Vicinamibacterales bacterium]
MSSRVCALLALCLAVGLSIGCGGEPPEKEIQQAQNAVDAAAAAGAETYAAEEFAAAKLALTNATSAVEQRDYRLALNDALDSRERAQNAAKEATAARAAARARAEAALSEADAALANAQDKLRAAEERKLSARVLGAPRSAINTAVTSLQEAHAAFDQGRFVEVPAKAKAATALLTAPLEQLEAAAAAPVRRRR